MKLWKKVASNLWRNRDSGNYYARLDAGGKALWKSLKTDAITVAKLRLPAKLAQMRAGAGKVNSGKLTLEDCAAIYLEKVRTHFNRYGRRNKPRSVEYREETLQSIRAAIPGFAGIAASTFGDKEVHRAVAVLMQRYGPVRYNGCLQTLKGILQAAVESGDLEKNPAAKIKPAKIRLQPKFVPERSEFSEILAHIDKRKSAASLSVRALAFTGLRPNEARHLELSDVDLKRRTITARETKNGNPRELYMGPQAFELFETEGVAKVLAALKKDPRKALYTASDKLKIARLTPYTLRRLFLTSLVESGIDIGAAADIAGHSDRGVTLLRNYRQTRSKHLERQLKKVMI